VIYFYLYGLKNSNEKPTAKITAVWLLCLSTIAEEGINSMYSKFINFEI